MAVKEMETRSSRKTSFWSLAQLKTVKCVVSAVLIVQSVKQVSSETKASVWRVDAPTASLHPKQEFATNVVLCARLALALPISATHASVKTAQPVISSL